MQPKNASNLVGAVTAGEGSAFNPVRNPPLDTEILPLTALRGVAALWVLVYHLRHELQDLFPQSWPWLRRVSLSGTFGVDLFFVLSGFVIALTSRERVRTLAGYGDFLARRLGRVYPAYLAAHLAFALFVAWRVATGRPELSRCATDVSSFFTHLLMVQAWTFPIERAWNLVDWSVSAEWLVYLLFPAYAWVARWRFGWVAGLLGVSAFAWALADVGESTNMELGLPRVLVGFAAGVAVERLMAWRGSPAWWWWIPGGLLLAGTGFLAAAEDAPVEPIAWAPVAFAGVVYCLARSSVYVPAPLRWLGHISYALYLSHSLTLLIVEEAKLALPVGGHVFVRLAWAAGLIGLPLAVGHLLFVAVERPARPRVIAWIRNLAGLTAR